MSVVMFAMVKMYPKGVRNPSIDYALNVSHIAGFRQLNFVRESDQENVPYVVVDMRFDWALAIEGTMDDLFAAIKQAEASIQIAANPYKTPIEPLRNRLSSEEIESVEQMRQAPHKAVFFWRNTEFLEATRLAVIADRSDLEIYGIDGLSDAQVAMFLGRRLSGVVVDHAAQLTNEQKRSYDWLRMRSET